MFKAAILALVNARDEFLLAPGLTSSLENRTLPVGITLDPGGFAFSWRLFSAALVVATVPIAVR